MNTSSTSLFHYTSSLDVVKLILQNGLRLGKLIEELPLRGHKTDVFSQLPGVVIDVQIRHGVCFCDLPLHLTENHRREYGQYSLGFAKEWAMNIGASPVRYIHRNSPDTGSEFFNTLLDLPELLQRHGSIFDIIAKVKRLQPPSFQGLTAAEKKILAGAEELIRAMLSHVDYSASFLRLHDGVWTDRVTNDETHRTFYDEREWRVIRQENEEYVTFTDEALTHILVASNEECDAIVEHAMNNCKNLRIRNREHFARKVRTFATTFGEA